MNHPETRLVVGAALIDAGRVLAARRARPPELAGRWELPGGKVEPGEAPEAALVRELAEELGISVAVTGWLDGAVPVRAGLELRVAAVRLLDGVPAATEHDRLRWLGAHELDAVDWLEPDRPFVAQLPALLAGPEPCTGQPLRGLFHEADDAQAAAADLRAAGYDVEVQREAFAGEDDDESHAWAVLTDAPLELLEPAVDAADGWLDVGSEGRPAAPGDAGPWPAPLPDRPRRTAADRGGAAQSPGEPDAG